MDKIQIYRYLSIWIVYGLLGSHAYGQFHNVKEITTVKDNGAQLFSFSQDNIHWYSSAGHGIFKWQNKKVISKNYNFYVIFYKLR